METKSKQQLEPAIVSKAAWIRISAPATTVEDSPDQKDLGEQEVELIENGKATEVQFERAVH